MICDLRSRSPLAFTPTGARHRHVDRSGKHTSSGRCAWPCPGGAGESPSAARFGPGVAPPGPRRRLSGGAGGWLASRSARLVCLAVRRGGLVLLVRGHGRRSGLVRDGLLRDGRLRGGLRRLGLRLAGRGRRLAGRGRRLAADGRGRSLRRGDECRPARGFLGRRLPPRRRGPPSSAAGLRARRAARRTCWRARPPARPGPRQSPGRSAPRSRRHVPLSAAAAVSAACSGSSAV